MKVKCKISIKLILLSVVLLGLTYSAKAQFIKGHSVATPAIEETLQSDRKEHEVLRSVENMPQFIGGDVAMMKFIYSKIKYPREARLNDIQGLVVISYVVMEDGSLSGLEIKRDIGGGCGEEALRVIKRMDGKWIPGSIDGEPVRVAYNLPVRFSLSDPTPKGFYLKE